MNTTTTPQTINAIQLLEKFVDSRPCLDFNDYGDHKIYRREAAEITRDRNDFYNLLRAANSLYYPEELNEQLINYLSQNSDRLSLKGEKLQYITGQYYPTEYRPAACRVLVSMIWRKLAQDKRNETGHDIRKAAKRLLNGCRRTYSLYFN